MSWVTIDTEICNACGLCVTRCAKNYQTGNGKITTHANAETCNLCGHCVALCPTDAITHEKMDMDNFLSLDRKLTFDTKEFFEFVRGRRSHRQFKDRKIPREDLEALVDLCRYTPTGSNRQTLEILIIEDEARIKRLSDMVVDFFAKSIEDVEHAVKTLEDEGKEVPADLRNQHTMLLPRKAMVTARDLGWDVIFHTAPALMIFHSTKDTSTPKDDCVIAAQTVVMTAMTMGLGTCYIGFLEGVSRSNPAINESLGLPDGNRIGSVLVLGYPKLTFLRSVDRLPMRVRWE